MDSNIEYITRITYVFFIYLILAILIERVVEVCVSAFNYADLKLDWYRIWNRKAWNYQDRFDRIYGFQGGYTPQIDKMLNWVLWKVLSEKPYPGGKESISAALIRLNYIKIGTRLLAFLIALIFTAVMYRKFDFNFVGTVSKLLPDSEAIRLLAGHAMLSILLTAVAVSLGSEPLHQLIARFEKKSESGKAVAKGCENERS